MRKPFMVELMGTPEAGKTTVIRNVANKLVNANYTVEILKESAEKLPQEIPKGSWDANLWMHYQTEAGILKATYSNADIVLVDRGLVDSKFYGSKFLQEQICTEAQYQNFCRQFIKELLPDFVLALVVKPNIAIKRRGGNGRLVNEEYILNYNKIFLEYFNKVKIPKEIIDTSELTTYKMCEEVYKLIMNILP